MDLLAQLLRVRSIGVEKDGLHHGSGGGRRRHPAATPLLGAQGGLDKGEERRGAAGLAQAAQAVHVRERPGDGQGGAGHEGEVGAPVLEAVEDMCRHDYGHSAHFALFPQKLEQGLSCQDVEIGRYLR
jgi:hypothetical protein